jgi:hypothetical protein
MNDEHAEDLKRRMKAALALAGITIEELAARINRRGYGTKTLYNMQGGKGARPILPADQEVIARACGLSPAFFTIDFADLPDTELSDRVAALESDLERLSPILKEPDALDALLQALGDLGLAGSPSREEAPSDAPDTGRRGAGGGAAGG